MPTELPVVGDAKEAPRGLLPLLKERADREFLGKYQRETSKWRDKMAALEDAGRDPVAPQYLMASISDLAADDAILTCDSGTIATWAARHWIIRGDRGFYLSGNLATMAPGLPYAIGIQHAFPDRQVIAFVGDGGFSMLMAEFLTAIQHRLPVKVVINNNNSLGQILWEQMVLGYPEHGVRYPEPFVDYAAFATANGALGMKVTKPADVRGALRTAHRRECQPGRAAHAGQGRVRAGEELRAGVPARPAAQGHHRHDSPQGPHPAAPLVAAATTA